MPIRRRCSSATTTLQRNSTGCLARVRSPHSPPMSRQQAIERAERYFDGGGFLADLGRRVAIRTESQEPGSNGELERYLSDEMRPSFEKLGFRCRGLPNPAVTAGPVL